jgi:trigger factor
MNKMRNVVLEDQAVETLLAKAQVTEKSISFSELMNQLQQE